MNQSFSNSDLHCDENLVFASTVVPQIQVTLNCNLACDYCFQDHTPGIIDLSTVERIIETVILHNKSVSPDLKMIQVYWHGGEPLLAGVNFFREILKLEAAYPDIRFENRIQTNGTLMNDDLARLFVDNQFYVGFSLDGPKDIHDAHRRIQGRNQGSFDDALRGIQCYQRHSGFDNVAIIAVITRTSINRARDIYNFFSELRAKVQLDIYDLRCADMVRLAADDPVDSELILSPQEVGTFLSELFDLWFHDPVNRADFSELRLETKMILQPDIDFGDPFHKKRCDFRRLIFAPNGLVFSCDQWVNDEKSALGDIRKDPLPLIVNKKNLLWREIKKRLRGSTDLMACGSCIWGHQCGGGCLACMKYNALLLETRVNNRPDCCWSETALPSAWEKLRGETYYCDGLRSFRQHVRETIERDLDER